MQRFVIAQLLTAQRPARAGSIGRRHHGGVDGRSTIPWRPRHARQGGAPIGRFPIVRGMLAGRHADQRMTPVERFHRNARRFRLYEGTSEVQRVIMGGALLREAGTARD